MTYHTHDAQGNRFTLLDVSKLEAWKDVKAVERRFDSKGRLTTVTNHRDKTFEQRRAEMAVGNF